MAGKSPVAASDEQKAALQALAGGAGRAEADRARAILLTLDNWTSSRIAQAFGVREDTGAPMAQRLHARRDRRIEGEPCSRARAAQGRDGIEGRRATSIATGRRPDELDAGPSRR
jgi:hypothetical protein